MGRIFEVVNSLDEVEEVNVIFTFCYRDRKYIVYKKKDDENSNYGDKVSCNPWYGIRFKYEWNDEAKEIAGLIMNQAKERPAFRLKGEHYEVERLNNDEGTYHIRKAKRRVGFSPMSTTYSDALRFAVTVVLAIIYAGFRLSLGAISWLYALFPYAERKSLLIGFWIFHIVATIAIFFLAKKNRSLWNMAYNIFLPVELIVVAAGLRSHSLMRMIVIGIVLVVAVGSIIYKLYSTSKPKGTKRMMSRNLRSFLGTVATVFFFSCLITTRLIGVTSVVYTSESRAENYGQLIENYNTACENIYPDAWEMLDDQKKVETLQAICDYECIIELGCDAPEVHITRWDSETLLGQYSHITGKLSISQDHFENDEVCDVVDTLLHEVRHAWQYNVTKIFTQIESELDEKQLALDFFRDAEEFRYNFDNYYNGDDYDAYAQQGIERDSREWAARRMAEKYYFCLKAD